MNKYKKLASDLIDQYISNWKKGFGLSIMLALALFLTGMVGYTASCLLSWLFEWKLNRDLIFFCCLACCPVYLGMCVDGLRSYLNSVK